MLLAVLVEQSGSDDKWRNHSTSKQVIVATRGQSVAFGHDAFNHCRERMPLKEWQEMKCRFNLRRADFPLKWIRSAGASFAVA